MKQASALTGPPGQPGESDLPAALHKRFMQAALREARKAARCGEVPIGAVIVKDGVIIGRGGNRRETRQDVTLHAELVAIRQACRRLGSWRLNDCQLYVTLEPCIMCAGAIVQARIRDVYFGTTDPKAGAAGSIVDIFAIRQNHVVQIAGGLLAADCQSILRDFFRARRLADKAVGSRAIRRSAAVIARQEKKTGPADLPDPEPAAHNR